ncbi:MAG: hypothetical protein K8T91_28255 [Planctomycetes bacterium]|nr:hypothetical protein [Planctomycetota bacterium]
MEREYQDVSEVVVRPDPQPFPQNRGNASRRNAPASNAQRFGGMHLRRDKRFPFAGKVVPDIPLPSRTSEVAPLAADPLTAWKEAVMLWLSWNSTQEKLTAKMCKPGQDQKKIEGLLDEADTLRDRAIELSEKLIRQAS